jgi:hypothetical protein
MYQCILATSISNRFARHFDSELKAFKRIYQVEEKAAKILIGQAR